MSKSDEKKEEKELRKEVREAPPPKETRPKIAFLSSFLVFPVIVGCVLSQFFGLLQLPFSEVMSWVMGGIIFFTGLLIVAKWFILWHKEYNGQLLTHGIYQYVRHPHYLGGILFMFGLSLFFRSIVALSFSALFMFLIAKGIKEEEEHLIKQYGDAYREYMKRVRWKLIPKVW